MSRRDNIAVREGKRIKRKSKTQDSSDKKPIKMRESFSRPETPETLQENPLESDFDIKELNSAIAQERKNGRTEKDALQTALDNLEKDPNYYVEHKSIFNIGGVSSDDFVAPEPDPFGTPPSVLDGDITQTELDLLRGTESPPPAPSPAPTNYEPTVSGIYHFEDTEKDVEHESISDTLGVGGVDVDDFVSPSLDDPPPSGGGPGPVYYEDPLGEKIEHESPFNVFGVDVGETLVDPDFNSPSAPSDSGTADDRHNQPLWVDMSDAEKRIADLDRYYVELNNSNVGGGREKPLKAPTIDHESTNTFQTPDGHIKSWSNMSSNERYKADYTRWSQEVGLSGE